MIKKKLPFMISVLCVSLLFSGCSKNKDKEPEIVGSEENDTQEETEAPAEEATEAAPSEAPTIHVETSGYILDDKERAHESGAIIHDMGQIEEYTGNVIETPEVTEVAPETEEVSGDSIEPGSEEGPYDGVSKNAYRIYLDPGHGGDAAGSTEFNGMPAVRNAGGAAIGDFPANSLGTTTGTSGGGYSECDTMYELAETIKPILEEHGYEVDLSRGDTHLGALGGGTAIGNWERGRLAAAYDAWVVLHADGGGGKGIHCVVYNNDPAFQNTMSNAFIKSMESKKRPIYTANGFNHGYSGNSSGLLQGPSMFLQFGGDVNNMLYIEAGFMDDKDDLEYMVSKEGQTEIAYSVLDGLNALFKDKDPYMRDSTVNNPGAADGEYSSSHHVTLTQGTNNAPSSLKPNANVWQEEDEDFYIGR